MFGLLSSVFGLLLYWGLISLPATTRRDGILLGASDVIGSISDYIYIYIYIYFFFLLRIRGLAMSELFVMGSPWAWLAVGLVLLYIYFFCLKVEHIIFFFFFNLMVFLIFD